MIDRREFLRMAALTAAWPCAAVPAQPSSVIVNDIHSLEIGVDWTFTTSAS